MSGMKSKDSMKKVLVAFSAFTLMAGSAMAQSDALWLRRSDISPDGSKIVFNYKGDIYTVGSKGGKAVQITSNGAHDTDPLWTPDGKEIVLSSYREKSKDIYKVSAEGGVPVRLTTYPGNETPKTILKDGSIVFSAAIQQDTEYGDFPGDAQLYIIGKDGGKPSRVTSLPVSELDVNAQGVILYEDYKGYEDTFRKHHTSSVTRDIWAYTPAAGSKGFTIDGKGTFVKLSSFKGEDRNPVFAADGVTFYYLSEADGTINIYKSSLTEPTKSVQLTNFTGNPVRYLSIAEDGTLCFSYDGELYTMKDGGKAEKVAVQIASDQVVDPVEYSTVSGNIGAADLSADNKEIAVVIRGDVYVTSVEYSTTKRITNTPEQERNVSFSPDGRDLYYSAERNGHWGIYKASLTDKRDKGFTYALKWNEELVTEPGQTCFQPAVSPDGKWLAFLRDRTDIVIKNIKSGKEKVLFSGVNVSYTDGDQTFQWSPDSHHILCNFQGGGGWNHEDVAMIDIDNGEVTNITESGYSDGSFKWALDGKAMTWESDRAGYKSHGSWGAHTDVYLMFFDADELTKWKRNKEQGEIADLIAGDKKKEKEEKADTTKEEKVKKLELDLENRQDRIYRLTNASASHGDHYLTKDGKKLYYSVRLEKGTDLCVIDLEKGDIKVLCKNVYGQFMPSKDGKDLYVLSGGGITKISTANGSKSSIAISGEYEYRPRAEREYIFNHVWKQVNEKFYDPAIHGIDWAGYYETYKKFLPHINNNFDFQEMLSELLGELNGSHTGARYSFRGGLNLGTLGVLFDQSYNGEGLKIAEVLPGGALTIADPEIKAGDVITAINGTEIKAGENWYDLFTRKAGKTLILEVKKGGKKAKEVLVTTGSSDASLLYNRWVKQREEMVEKLSGGKIAYVHVEGMNSDSFRRVYSKLLGKYRNHEAVIVDTRHNGGGWLHDDLVTLLSGTEYIHFEHRGRFASVEPFAKWTKPSCVLVGEDNYSDACGFPYAYKSLGIGKLIGAPVPGTMTAVWWETQVDPTLVFGIPQIGSLGLKEGRFLENMQIEPDILIYNDPASVLRGEDKQLEAAVKEMLKEIENK